MIKIMNSEGPIIVATKCKHCMAPIKKRVVRTGSSHAVLHIECADLPTYLALRPVRINWVSEWPHPLGPNT